MLKPGLTQDHEDHCLILELFSETTVYERIDPGLNQDYDKTLEFLTFL